MARYKLDVSFEERLKLDRHNELEKKYVRQKQGERLHKLVLEIFKFEPEGLTASEIAEELNDKWIVRERKTNEKRY